MTLAQLRSAIRNLLKESEDSSGTLFPSNNTLLDFFIDTATELVVIDLVEFLPHVFLTSENITLVANQNNYSLSGEVIQYWAMMKNVSDENPVPLTYIDPSEVDLGMYVGETDPEPSKWYYAGSTIYFVPTPSSAKTNYAKIWYIQREAADVATGGPTLIPAGLHKLIVFQACLLIATMDGAKTDKWEKLYGYFLNRAHGVYGARIQNQPRFLKGSYMDRMARDTRDKALYDLSGFFER